MRSGGPRSLLARLFMDSQQRAVIGTLEESKRADTPEGHIQGIALEARERRFRSVHERLENVDGIEIVGIEDED